MGNKKPAGASFLVSGDEVEGCSCLVESGWRGPNPSFEAYGASFRFLRVISLLSLEEERG